MSELSDASCCPCQPGDVQLAPHEIAELLRELPHWSVIEHNTVLQLQCSYRFADFSQAMAFSNAVAAVSEAANHHPALLTEWGKVTVTWWSHSLQGLHQNDFIMAARTTEIARLTGGAAD